MPSYVKPYKGHYLIAIYEIGGEERCLASCLNARELAVSLYGDCGDQSFMKACTVLNHIRGRGGRLAFGGLLCEVCYIPVTPDEVAQMVVAKEGSKVYAQQ